MSDRVNQHFVPKFYFRNFSADGHSVCSLLLKDGRVIPRSPIKSQCSRNNFYGSKEIEELFSKLEMSHSDGINAALDIAYNDDAPSLSKMEFESLLHGVAFRDFARLRDRKVKGFPRRNVSRIVQAICETRGRGKR